MKNSFKFRKIFGKIVIFLLNRDEFFSEFHVHDGKMLKFLEMQAKFAKFSENSGKIRKRVTKFIPGMNNSIPSLKAADGRTVGRRDARKPSIQKPG